MENTPSNYFTKEALQKMVSVQGKTIEKIICFMWQNIVDANNSVEIIDSLQLCFTDKTSITIGCNATSEGLDILEINLEELRKQLYEEFQGKIKIHAIDASKTKMWVDVIGKKMNAIQLTKEENNYKSDAIMIDFGDEGRTVSMSPYDGIVIDYYEEN